MYRVVEAPASVLGLDKLAFCGLQFGMQLGGTGLLLLEFLDAALESGRLHLQVCDDLQLVVRPKTVVVFL